MKRLFTQTKIYDYSSKKEAEKHIDEMRDKGWRAKTQFHEDGSYSYIYEIEDDDYPYSVEYYKEK